MKKILLIIPYFGKFPNYFELWLKSVEYNKSIDFLIITDNEIKKDIPNVKVINMTFNELREYIQSKFSFKIYLPNPYRLCEFKPTYGYIFPQYIEGYDFWGCCDMDMIFGDLRSFLTEEVLENNEKILSHAHLSLFKNNDKMNNLFFIKRRDCVNYKQAFTEKIVLSNFDEYPHGISRIAKKENIKVYEKCIFADLDTFFFTFRKLAAYFTETKDDPEDIIQFFRWNSGKLYNVILTSGQREIKELAYVHFQKRNMDSSEISLISDCFSIIPNKFIAKEDLSDEFVYKICDLDKNDFYCKEIKNKLSKGKKRSILVKLFSMNLWKRRWFNFKMEKIYKIQTYQFSKGGF